MWSVSRKVAERFLDLLWDKREGWAELRVFEPRPEDEHEVTQYFFEWPKNRDLLFDGLEDLDWDDVFMGVLLRTDAGYGDAEHTEKETSWLWADIDKKRGITFGTLLSRISHYPQVVVDSGHGWHLYWRLASPVPVTIAQGAMSVLADRLGGDRVGDPARIMRLPGTLNNKDDEAMPVRLLRFDPVFTHRFSDFDQPEPEPEYESNGEMEGWELSGEDAPKFGEGERNNGLTRLAGAMLFKGMAQEDILVALSAENAVRCDPPLRQREVEAIVKSVWRYK